jgi:glycosyltransferase involved in cell wall biosynthesis
MNSSIELSTMGKEHLVTVYIATKDRFLMLQRAINSVFNQTYKNYEIIISDDGSQDETQKYCEHLVSIFNNIKYIRSSVSCGACKARNKAIYASNGYFITGLDDDDEFLPDRLERFVTEWESKYSFLCSNFLDSKNMKLKKYYLNSWYDKKFSLNHILTKNTGSSQIFTLASRLKEIGGYSESVEKFQDWDTWIKLSAKYGSFLRLSKTTYILHHDHVDEKTRVSNSISHVVALEGIYRRNIHLYKNYNKATMESKISYRHGNYLFTDLLSDFFKYFDPLFIIRYFKQGL